MHILIIGGGAAGVSAALTLCKYSDVTIDLIESRDRLGGMADSFKDEYGQYVNYGVQGVHETFQLTLHMVNVARKHNPNIIKPIPVSLSSRFLTPYGLWDTKASVTSTYWRKFRAMCLEAQAHPDIYALMTIVDACRSYFIPRRFIDGVLLPLLALFFGTGNQVAEVPAALAAQVFRVSDKSNSASLFDLGNDSLITMANMRALPPLKLVYMALHEILLAHGVNIMYNRSVPAESVTETSQGVLVDGVTYDRVIIATQAPDACRILSPQHRAQKVLKAAIYHDDVTYTHRDTTFMKEMFALDPEQPFNYYIRSFDRRDIVMGFDVSNYQQWISTKVYQTIYLDHVKQPHVLPKKVIHKADWHQLGPSVEHLVKCVGGLRKVQGPRIYFAGSYTLFNSHEVAIMSGIAAGQQIIKQLTKRLEFPMVWFGQPTDAYNKYVAQMY
jgi:predicted NAD/FAD-binding protein